MTQKIKGEIQLPGGERGQVDLNHPVHRHAGNPILTAREVNRVWTDPALKVMTVHNAGVAQLGNETLMLFRSHLRSGISVLGIARSRNGVDGWHMDPEPAFKPATSADCFARGVDPEAAIRNEAGGVEDPRIMSMGDLYAVTYSAYHGSEKNRVRVSLATTRDFRTFTRHGPMLDRDMRNVVIFNEKIKGRYAALFRPNDVMEGDVGGIFTQIRIGYTDDWMSNRWTISPEPIMKTGGGPSAFSDKIGPSAPPMKTESGWLNIIHGVRSTMDGNPYVLGVVLHDLDDPARIRVCSMPILFPSKADCRVGEEDYIHVPNVVFTCGCLLSDDGVIRIYYAGNDTVMNLGFTHRDVLIALCERFGQDPISGKRLYVI